MLTLAFVVGGVVYDVAFSILFFYKFLMHLFMCMEVRFLSFLFFLYKRKQKFIYSYIVYEETKRILCRKDHNSLYKLFIILTTNKLFWSQN